MCTCNVFVLQMIYFILVLCVMQRLRLPQQNVSWYCVNLYINVPKLFWFLSSFAIICLSNFAIVQVLCVHRTPNELSARS